MKYIVTASDRSITTNKSNLTKTIQTLLDEGFDNVNVSSIGRSSLLKHKVGDRVRITKNVTEHYLSARTKGLDIGDIVIIDKLYNETDTIQCHYSVKSLKNGMQWWISDSECESI